MRALGSSGSEGPQPTHLPARPPAVDDVGYKPFVESWISKLECADYKPLLTTLFSRYVETTLEHCRRNFKTVTPLPAINQVQTLCKVRRRGGAAGGWRACPKGFQAGAERRLACMAGLGLLACLCRMCHAEKRTENEE